MTFAYMLGGVVILILSAMMCSFARDIANDKGYEKQKWFHMCFWMWPLSNIMIAAMPDKVLRNQQDEICKLLLPTQQTLAQPEKAQAPPAGFA